MEQRDEELYSQGSYCATAKREVREMSRIRDLICKPAHLNNKVDGLRRREQFAEDKEIFAL